MKYFDRVKESSTSTGTGAFTLAGAATGFRTFASVLSTNDICYYCIAMGSEWEVGYGTYSATNTLTRTTVTASSNSGSAVNFSAGTKEVFLTVAARRFDTIDLSSASSDYLLLPGETAKVVYSLAESVPLHTTTVDGDYEIKISCLSNTSMGTAANVALEPNSATYTSAFRESIIDSRTGSLNNTTLSRFIFAADMVLASNLQVSTRMNSKTILTDTAYKKVNGEYAARKGMLFWDDTNAWTSLGLIRFAFAQSGTIIIKRIA